MVGEISPDMMFLGFCQKCSKLSVDGCRPVRMGAIGYVFMGSTKNKAKECKMGEQDMFCDVCTRSKNAVF